MSTAIPYNMPAERERTTSAAWTLEQVVCWFTLAGLVFFMGADFRGDTGEKFQVHWQIYLRLLLALGAGAVGGLLLFPKTYRDFLAWPGLLVTAYVGIYAVTLPMSLDRNYSAAAWVSLVCVLLFVFASLRVLGGYRFFLAIAAGLSMFLIGSWIAYLVFPEVGVFKEQVTRTEVFERMGGLAHPNELGVYSAYTVLVFSALGISRRLPWWIAGLGILLGAATLAGCFSRTSILVCSMGLVFTFAGYWRLRSNFIGILMVVAMVLLAAFAALGTGQLDWQIEKALKGATKTGSTKELSTATGRTEIWAYGSSQIAESPLYGYGYCSARFIMEEYSYHCHNIVLNAMMFGGMIAGIIVAGMILYLWHGVFFNPRPEVDGIAVFMLIGGMVEGLLGAPSPAASTILWFTVLIWRQVGAHIAVPSSEVGTNTTAVASN